MANTRSSAKRARQNQRRQVKNQRVRTATRSLVRLALDAIQSKDGSKAQTAYQAAIRALSRAASKGAMPSRRAARKVSRLTHLAKKVLPDVFSKPAKLDR